MKALCLRQVVYNLKGELLKANPENSKFLQYFRKKFKNKRWTGLQRKLAGTRFWSM